MDSFIVEVFVNPWIVSAEPNILPNGPTPGEVLQMFKVELAKQLPFPVVQARLMAESPIEAPNIEIAAGEAMSRLVRHVNAARSRGARDETVEMPEARYITYPGSTTHFKSGLAAVRNGPVSTPWQIEWKVTRAGTEYAFKAVVDLTIGLVPGPGVGTGAGGAPAMGAMPGMPGHDHDHSSHKFSEFLDHGYPPEALRADTREYFDRPRDPVLVRRDQGKLQPDEQQAFCRGVEAMIKDGSYPSLVAIHQDGSHRMHGLEGVAGFYRFLAWHRRFLLAFEREFVRVQLNAGTPRDKLMGVPYWRLTDPFPAWLESFLPAVDPANPPTPRAKTPANLVPTAQDVKDIMEHSDQQLKDEPAPTNAYVRFTYALEGWGVRADKTNLPAHNHRHAWIGGLMDRVAVSPCDPVFWLLHSEIDRLWSIWQEKNPGQWPPLYGPDLIMDPWSETFTDLTDTSRLGYSFFSKDY